MRIGRLDVLDSYGATNRVRLRYARKNGSLMAQDEFEEAQR